MLHIGNLRTHSVQTCLNSQRRKASKVFMAVKTLLRDCELHFAVDSNGCRCVGVEHIEAQNQHELDGFPRGVWLDHSLRLDRLPRFAVAAGRPRYPRSLSSLSSTILRYGMSCFMPLLPA